MLRGVVFNGSSLSLVVLQLFSVGIAALIPLGLGGSLEARSELRCPAARPAGSRTPFCVRSLGMGRRLLAQLGALDAGGAGVIHSLSEGLPRSPWCGFSGRDMLDEASEFLRLQHRHGRLRCALMMVGWLGLDAAVTAYPSSGTRSAPAASSPSQPTIISAQPKPTMTMLWPGIAIPLTLYLPCRGPRIHTMASAVTPPTE